MRYLYLHGFASGPLSRKAQFFRDKLSSVGVPLEIPALDQGDFEHLTITGQLDFITRLAEQRASRSDWLQHGRLSRGALCIAASGRSNGWCCSPPPSAFGARWAETFGEDKVAEWRTRGHAEVYHYATRDCAVCRSICSTIPPRHPGCPRCPAAGAHLSRHQDNVVPISASETWINENQQARLLPVESGHELLDVLETIWDQARAFLLTPPSASANLKP